MKELAYRKRVAELLHGDSATVVQELSLRYRMGDYFKGRVFGMPDVSLDIVSLNRKSKFELYELKMLDSQDIWTGKFIGQMLHYNFLFRTECWNELAGRFAMRARNQGFVHGDIGRILSQLAGCGKGEDYREGDKYARFESLALVVCGGKGYELAAGFNPIIWSFWFEFGEMLKSQKLKFKVFHAYLENGELEFHNLKKLNVDGFLTDGARRAYEADELSSS